MMQKRMFTSTQAKNQSGFTMIEVMVAMVILGIGLLGLAAFQANGMRQNNNSLGRSYATMLAYDMADRIRANPAGQAGGAYSIGAGAAPAPQDCIAANCADTTGVLQAGYDIFEWRNQLSQFLPSGTGSITGGGAIGIPVTITVMWDEARTGALGTACGGNEAVDLKCYTLSFIP